MKRIGKTRRISALLALVLFAGSFAMMPAKGTVAAAVEKTEAVAAAEETTAEYATEDEKAAVRAALESGYITPKTAPEVGKEMPMPEEKETVLKDTGSAEAPRIRGGNGSKSSPYRITFSRAELTATKNSFREKVQAGLNLARKDGSHYYHISIPKGTYTLSSTLRIFSRTKLSAKGAKIISANGNTLLVAGYNHSSAHPSATGYGGHKYITVVGGNWNGNGKVLAHKGKTKSGCLMRFAHVTGLSVRGATFTNVLVQHHVEIAAVKNCKFKSCRFRNLVNPKKKDCSEALQIDVIGKDTFPGFYNGNGNHYGCKNVEVKKCVFANVAEGVGSHSYSGKHPYRNIRVHGNTFKNLRKHSREEWVGYSAVRAMNWLDSKIYSNRISSVTYGISLDQDCSGSRVFKNRVSHAKKGGIIAVNANISEINENRVSSSGYGICGHTSSIGTITKNSIKYSKTQGIYILRAAVSKISKNSVKKSGGTALSFQFRSNVASISRNRISVAKRQGILVSTLSHVNKISKNKIRKAKKVGIKVSGATVVKVKGNKISKCGKKNKGVVINGGTALIPRVESASLKKGKKMKVPAVWNADHEPQVTSSDPKIVKIIPDGKHKGKLKGKKKGQAVILITDGPCSADILINVV